jgi:hypothetical protein
VNINSRKSFHSSAITPINIQTKPTYYPITILKVGKMNKMIVPIESVQQASQQQFFTLPSVNYDDSSIASTTFLSQDHATMLGFNLSSVDLCVQLRENLTDLQQAEIDWNSLGCFPNEHAPILTDKVVVKVIVLGLMGFLSLIGNIATIWNIQKNRATRRALRHSCSAIYVLILHLSVADILVTFFCIIGEAIWSYTVAWLAGDIACKLVKIFQMFALYLSTNVLVLIGIDRWVAVKYPMKSKFLNTARFVVSI